MYSSAPRHLGTSATLVARGVAWFAINPLQQYRVIKLAPCTQNVVLVLDYTSLAALRDAGALCTLRPELNRPS